MSGRPFDEAHPVLDFDLPGMDTRIAAITPPLSPDGTAFAFRLHKVTPWTLAQFIDVDYISPLGAGLMSFFIDSQATTIVTGSRGSGKCVDSDSLLQISDGTNVKIGEFVDSIVENAWNKIPLEDGVCVDLSENGFDYETLTMNSALKMEDAKISKVWRRKAPGEMVSLKLRSGKTIITTPEHPFFLTSGGKVIQKRADELSVSDFVATPRIIKVKSSREVSLDWLKTKLSFEPKLLGVDSEVRKKLKNMSYLEMRVLSEKLSISFNVLNSIRSGRRQNVSFSELKKFSRYFNFDFLKLVESSPFWVFYNSKHKIKPDFFIKSLDLKGARFLGLLFGDGHLDELQVSLSNTNMDLLNEFKALCKELFNVDARIVFPKDRVTYCQVSSTGLARMLSLKLGIPLGKKADVQEMSEDIVKSENLIVAQYLRGYFDCDASVDTARKTIEFATASKRMVFDVQNSLQRFGILSTVRGKMVNSKEYYRLFISGKNAFKFSKEIGFSLDYKKKALDLAFIKEEFNTNIDIIPNCLQTLELIQKQHRVFTSRVISLDQNNISRQKMQRLISNMDFTIPEVNDLKRLANSEIFWDEILEARKMPYAKKFVYDLTVDNTHNFVANGVIAHNTSLMSGLMLEILQNSRIIVQEDTLELPVEYLKNIGFNIQRLKTRSPIGVQENNNEVSPEDALRTSLRLGDSALVVGEVRSKEAKVLYEAMRVGAAGNVVMGTIHGDSAYSVWDRVVNDLEVPTTSFKATDIVCVARPIRFKGSLEKHRRVVQITEVKKHWTGDPSEEGGLLDLMNYNAKKDKLELVEDNLKESDLFSKISNLSGLSHEKIWKNIRMTAESKSFLVDLKNEFNLPSLLEAENTILANNKLVILKEDQLEEFGSIDYNELIGKWKNWVRKDLVKRVKQRS